ncbi:fumarylacetoacetate hydrolase family protein [Anaerobium acetethylicum]|uniref:2-keto-4-pentenoate hydratase/2-oxohepta-3-ene-1,7-dioic acid hydratase (Catechol pathway) n=1 Tax=Anaerobium acetethylicum TaxID=1619234 RepID=A0A1D3TUZ7_9FIRM|nr:fumarylacetoacetate hydrolase family protein [Anaerobium acetethylicum]SCP97954.1 2-keto-4-pentenoate hydratase/2-oxohepta-3-ene-1,7-dioic acid hydratase (catechol pathway) [Anaerobium acetethylicum]
MKLLTYKQDGFEKIGAMDASGTKVLPLEQFGITSKTMNELVCSSEDLKKLQAADFSNAENQILYAEAEKCAPIPCPMQDIICLGINYNAHAEEAARFKKDAFGREKPFAIYFGKRVNEAVGTGEGIPAHRDITKQLDYEAELAVILSKDAKNVKLEDAYDYVFGFTVLNDISAREIQTQHKQWYFGKSLDGFTPMGPWIVTKDEIVLPPRLNITSKVNGELRQNSNTELLIFSIEHVISELSQGITLKAGTIISMGTPAGVGMGMDPPTFLNPGDVVECQIEGIGTLVNEIIE